MLPTLSNCGEGGTKKQEEHFVTQSVQDLTCRVLCLACVHTFKL